MKWRIEDYFENLANFEYRELFYDLENIWEVLERLPGFFENFFKNLSGERIQGELEEGVVLAGENIFIAKGTKVESGAYLKGPTIISQNCQIRSGAYVRGGVILDQECIVGHASEVKNAIFLRHTFAPHFNYVGDSILGSGVNLGGGSILANFRFDAGQIKAENQATGLNKLGAVLGDKVRIGCNAVTAPGTFIKKGGWLMPATYLKSGIYSKEDLKNMAKNS